jgi:hypothetical protein
MTFLSVFSVIADLDGLDLIVASRASPASETATAAFVVRSGCPLEKSKIVAGRLLSRQALTGERETAGTCRRAAFSF